MKTAKRSGHDYVNYFGIGPIPYPIDIGGNRPRRSKAVARAVKRKLWRKG